MTFVKNCTIGIVGFGRFGRLMAHYLSPDFPVRAYDPSVRTEAMAAAGAAPAAIDDVCRSDIVILAVPISRLQALLSAIGPHLQPESLLVDVCSVKEQPVRWMQELLPETVDILGTHPMFGPDSAADSLEGRKIVLCPVRIGDTRLEKVQALSWTSKGLVLIETSAEPTTTGRSPSALPSRTTIGRSLAQFGAKAAGDRHRRLPAAAAHSRGCRKRHLAVVRGHEPLQPLRPGRAPGVQHGHARDRGKAARVRQASA